MAGFPTPETIPATRFCRRISIPDSPEWIGVITGALLNLTEATNWEEVGALTPDECAAESWNIINAYFDANGCPTDLDPPYWENPQDVDDDTSLYPWYDQLGDWLIAGFLATTFTPATGITYITSVPKARLAFRKGEFGASLRILLDGLEAFAGDTAGDPDEFLNVNLDFEAFALANGLGAGPWTMRVEHSGVEGERLEIVRKDLRRPNLRSIYGDTPPTFDEIAEDYEAEYGVPLVPIELQQVGGQLQYRYSSTSDWLNVPNADNVRRDGSVAMTGGLEITPVSNEVNLTVKPHVTQNIAVVEVFGADQASKTRFASDGSIYNEATLYLNTMRGLTNNWGYVANGNASANALFWVNKTAQPGRVPLAVSGSSGQTANLQNWLTSGVADIVASISANGAATFRSQMKIQGLSSTSTARDMAILYTVYADNIDAQRRAKVVLAPYFYGGNQDAIGAEAHPDGVRLKFYDALSPVVKQTVTGERQANEALASLLDALEAVGLITDSTTVGDAPYTQAEADEEKCRVAFGVGERLVNVHLLDYFIWLTANAGSLDYLDPSTYDPLMASYGLEYTDYNAARAWSIDWTFNWENYGTYATFDDLVTSMLPFLSDNIETIQCAFLRHMTGTYLTQTGIDGIVADLENMGLLSPRWLLVAGLIEYTSASAWAELVNLAAAYGGAQDCLVCSPFVPTEFATLSLYFGGSLSKTKVAVGNTFTYTVGASGGGFDGGWTSDKNIELNVVSVSGYGAGTYQYRVSNSWGSNTAGPPPTGVRTADGYVGNSSTLYTITYEVISFP